MIDNAYFPFEIRKEQDELLTDCIEAVTKNKILLANAPTGLGKTVATISAALFEAIKNDKTIFFVTSRHTQHKIVIETLKVIKEKFNLDFSVADFIGKMWMCAVPGISLLTSSEFSEFCKTMIEKQKCDFYKRTKSKNQLSFESKKILEDLKKTPILGVDEVKEIITNEELCPFEISCELAKNAKVIIADYYHIFHPNIRRIFLKRIDKSISDSIIIVDEAHNLPFRIRDLASSRLSTFMITRAISEIRALDRQELLESLNSLSDILSSLSEKIKGYDTEIYITKEEFLSKVNLMCDDDVESFTKHLYSVGEEILQEKKISFLVLIADFLTAFDGPELGFARILTKSKDQKGKTVFTLSYSCLDPSLITKEIFETCKSAIIMSGTLNPPEMYRDVLGISAERAIVKTYKSPFKKENRLAMIIPKTTTKFTSREPSQYENIAIVCSKCTNAIPGNVAVFIPSYNLLENITKYFNVLSKKTIFSEKPGLSKHEREEMLEEFKSYQNKGGAVLFGVSGGSYSEGIDLPGDDLIGVIVVGLPMTKPDLETQSTIDYYDKLFKRGFDYGYMFLAFNKVLQAAGRCIRTENDRGVMIFLDERFIWKNYYRCFPTYLDIFVESENYVDKINSFFKK